MRESRLSGSVEGVMSDHDSYSDLRAGFDLLELSGYGRQSTGGANPRREVSV